MTLLGQPHECWDYRHHTTCLAWSLNTDLVSCGGLNRNGPLRLMYLNAPLVIRESSYLSRIRGRGLVRAGVAFWNGCGLVGGNV